VSAGAVFAVRTTGTGRAGTARLLSVRARSSAPSRPVSAEARPAPARAAKAQIIPSRVSSRDALLVPDTSPKFAAPQLQTERDRSGQEQMLACALNLPALAPRYCNRLARGSASVSNASFSFHPTSASSAGLISK
jgi:hypothetical protein